MITSELEDPEDDSCDKGVAGEFIWLGVGEVLGAGITVVEV